MSEWLRRATQVRLAQAAQVRILLHAHFRNSPTVRIPAFHAGDRGSIPRYGTTAPLAHSVEQRSNKAQATGSKPVRCNVSQYGKLFEARILKWLRGHVKVVLAQASQVRILLRATNLLSSVGRATGF